MKTADLHWVGVIFRAPVAWVTGDTQLQPVYSSDLSQGEDVGMSVVRPCFQFGTTWTSG